MQNAESFRELVENPTEVLPLDLAVSLIAGVANNSIQATDIVTALDDLASRCKASNACELMTFLFGSGKFAGNTINFDEAENSLFDRVLERRLGIPISLCVLAIEVGRRLALLAKDAQVIVVTHLPQVAAWGDQHYVVEKSIDGTVISSGVTSVQGEDRISEIARMLAGLQDSSSAKEHAAELLNMRLEG